VLIDIPKDVQMQAIEISAWPSPGERQPHRQRMPGH
jgi:acetolactate synthase-1/2/3 large subunit